MVALAALHTTVLDYKQWHRAALSSATMAVSTRCQMRDAEGKQKDECIRVLTDAISALRESELHLCTEYASIMSNVFAVMQATSCHQLL